jgi:two-component sensor histidine kinase
MDAFLHRLFTAKSDFPVWVRYLLSLGLVGIAFFARVMADEYLRSYPLLLFIPAIFLSSVLFGRGCGIVATAAAAALAIAYLIPSPASTATIPLVLFVITGLCIAAITELLRTTLRKLSEAKQYGDVLLQELAHRTRNDLATIVSILRLQARSETDPAVQRAIASAVSRVDVVAKVHDRLRETADTSRITLAPYIESLCASLADFHRGVRTISIRVRCEDIWVRSSQAASIGLIVNELVTNCFKYAFPEGRHGSVEVELRAKENRILVSVRDDGIGCSAEAKSGLGTRLINLLATQMKGTVARKPLPQGCEVQVSVALDS